MSGKSAKRGRISGVFFGLLLFYTALVLLLGISAAMLQGGILHEGQMKIAVLLSLCIASILSCMISVRNRTEKRLLYAGIPAVSYFILVLIGLFLLEEGKTRDGFTWVSVMVTLLPALVIGLKRQRKRRKR